MRSNRNAKQRGVAGRAAHMCRSVPLARLALHADGFLSANHPSPPSRQHGAAPTRRRRCSAPLGLWSAGPAGCRPPAGSRRCCCCCRCPRSQRRTCWKRPAAAGVGALLTAAAAAAAAAAAGRGAGAWRRRRQGASRPVAGLPAALCPCQTSLALFHDYPAASGRARGLEWRLGPPARPVQRPGRWAAAALQRAAVMQASRTPGCPQRRTGLTAGHCMGQRGGHPARGHVQRNHGNSDHSYTPPARLAVNRRARLSLRALPAAVFSGLEGRHGGAGAVGGGGHRPEEGKEVRPSKAGRLDHWCP